VIFVDATYGNEINAERANVEMFVEKDVDIHLLDFDFTGEAAAAIRRILVNAAMFKLQFAIEHQPVVDLIGWREDATMRVEAVSACFWNATSRFPIKPARQSLSFEEAIAEKVFRFGIPARTFFHRFDLFLKGSNLPF
jgi:hypothetical protein